MPRTADKPKKKYGRWKPIFILHVYRMLRAGMSEVDLCKELKVSRAIMFRWKKEKPELKEAWGLALKEREESQSFQDWVYQRLSPEIREIWAQIRQWEKEPNGVVKIELMLQDQGRHVRQQLFLHAFCVSHFNMSTALKRVNIARSVLYDWIERDPDFAALVKEIEWHKGNFFENQLVQLVRQGVPAAVIFANKSFNKDRGYASRQELEVHHSGEVLHGVLDLSLLIPYLTENAKSEVMAALRLLEENKNRPPLTAQEVVAEQIVTAAEEAIIPVAVPKEPLV